MTKLIEVLPKEFINEFTDTRAWKLRHCEVVREHSLGNDDGPYESWPGPARHVMHWWELADGRCVGWNENPSRGWSFPVFGSKTKWAPSLAE